MSRSEIVFWAVAVAIVAFSGIVMVVASHNRHAHGGFVTPPVNQDLAAAVE